MAVTGLLSDAHGQPGSSNSNNPPVKPSQPSIPPETTGPQLRSYDDHNDANPDNHHNPHTTSAQSFTSRSLLVGLAIGTLMAFSNTYFGLQTGWVSTMAMPSSLIGFAVFRALSRHLSFPFTPVENVLIQTVAGAVGTMPLGCGFVGVVPAMEFLLREGADGEVGGGGGPGGDDGLGEGGPLKLGFWKLVVWSLGVCLFGVVFAVPLRREVIIREKLRFPSGTATALMIRVLHGGSQDEKGKGVDGGSGSGGEGDEERERLLASEEQEENPMSIAAAELARDRRKDWKGKIKLLTYAFGISAVYTLVSYFIPQLRNLPIFGFSLATQWLWTLNPSPAYVGQGIIMGPSTSLHMLVGAILGWGILSPLAKNRGWASGPVDDWENGSKGWIVWVSLAIMLADSIISLGWLMLRPIVTHGPALFLKLQHNAVRKNSWRGLFNRSSQGDYTPIHHQQPSPNPTHDDNDDDAPPSQLISTRTVLILLPLTLILNVICMHISFGNLITPALSILATFLALFLSIMGVRALGETDLNPVSGISKLTQLIFALATPASGNTRRTAIVTNLLAGAVSEAGALQAGDMMQDLKTGHLLGASPEAQFYGQAIGSLFGALISTAVYKLYINVYDVPSSMFQVPTAYVWIFTARLVTGQGLPEMAWPTASIAGMLFAVITVVRIVGANVAGRKGGSAPWRAWVPGGIAVAVGMYNVPSFTLARAIGGVIAWWWGRKRREQKQQEEQRQELVQEDWRSESTYFVTTDGAGRDDATELPVGAGGGDESKGHGDGETGGSTVVILASGLILGEGIMSIVNLVLASARVPHL
ncbi:hypothetical protein FQN51_005237 [Onygenales sp. PD_10]|nr:hypothetical protein FQN51_005237 [Onygenales sp. PD_10]